MKSFTGLLKTVVAVILISPLMAESCSDNENVGYHCVDIPGYTTEEYYQMLYSPNEEIQYNAVCLLFYHSDMALLVTDSLKETPAYKLEMKIYNKIYSMMDAKNSWISSAAIRYIGKFEYNSSAFQQYALRNNNPSVNVQLAINSIWDDKDIDTVLLAPLLKQKVKFCFSHPSWLIKQSAYDYIIPATAHEYETDFIQQYGNAAEKYKKLQLLEILKMHLCDTAFDFLSSIYLTEKDTSLKKIILLSLPQAINKSQALNWFMQHKEETEIVLTKGDFYSYGKAFYYDLVLFALQQGWNPENVPIYSNGENAGPLLFNLLFEDKYSYEYLGEHPKDTQPPQTESFKKIEQYLLGNTRLKPMWLKYENEHLQFSLPAQLVKEHQQLTAKYVDAIKVLFANNNLDSTVYKDFLVQLENNANSLYRSKFPVKPADKE
jgi:hypothetical protein